MSGSTILGSKRLGTRFKAYANNFEYSLGKIIETRLKGLQEDVVRNAPRDTGRMADAFADAEALRFRRNSRGRIISGEFGLLNNRLGRMGFHAFFVEFGTKGYVAGDVRFAGKHKRKIGSWFYVNRDTFKGSPERYEFREVVSKRGKVSQQARRIDQARFSGITRDIPARPAHPFIRPAAVRLFAQMGQDRALATLAAQAWAATLNIQEAA